jgi:hypothetical protein
VAETHDGETKFNVALNRHHVMRKQRSGSKPARDEMTSLASKTIFEMNGKVSKKRTHRSRRKFGDITNVALSSWAKG